MHMELPVETYASCCIDLLVYSFYVYSLAMKLEIHKAT